MSSIWAKGCVLMIMCVLFDLTRLPFLGGWRKSWYIIINVYLPLRSNQHIHRGSPLIPIFCALSRSLYRHLSAAKGHHHTIRLAKPLSLTYFHHQHPSSHMVLIHSLHVYKPSQCVLSDPLYSVITFLFQPLYSNSIQLRHSHQTSQTLHLKDIHFLTLRTSYTPCLYSVQCRWYNYYSFI